VLQATQTIGLNNNRESIKLENAALQVANKFTYSKKRV
jgi:hypothetical protein